MAADGSRPGTAEATMLSSMSSEMMEAMLSSVAEKLAARPDTAPEELSRPGTAEAAMLSSMSQEQVAALLSTVSEKLAARPATAAEEGSRPGTAEGNMLSFVASDLMASMMASVSEKLAARPVTAATRPATARVDHAPEDEVVQSKEPEAAVAEPAATAAEEPVVPTAEEQAVAAVEEHPTLPARPAVPGPGAEYKDGAFEMVQTVLKSTLARMETGGSAASFGSIDAKVAVRDIIDGWKLNNTWKYHLKEGNLGGDAIEIEALFSIPTRRRPVPNAYAGVTFLVADRGDDLQVRYRLHAQSLLQPEANPLGDVWLHDQLEAKRLVMEEFPL